MRIWLSIGVLVLAGMISVPGASSQSGPGGGLTVKQARASRLTGVLLVRGFVTVDRRGRVRLCECIAGVPAACGGAELLVKGAPAAQFGPLQRAEGLAWSARPRSVFGRLRHGNLVFAPHVI